MGSAGYSQGSSPARMGIRVRLAYYGVVAAMLVVIAAHTIAAGIASQRVLDGAIDSLGKSIEITPVLRIYRDGTLVYEKIGDPPTENLARILAVILTPSQQQLITLDNHGVTLNHGDQRDALVGQSYYPRVASAGPLVLAGYLLGPALPTVHNFTVVGEAPATVLYIGWSDEGFTEFIIKIKGTIAFNTNTTINTVGLAIQPVVDGARRKILVFVDKLPQPISVTNTDSLTVVYEIRIKWPG